MTLSYSSTLREQIMQAVVARYATMQAGQPTDDPYSVQFDFVRRNPLDEYSWTKLLTLGVHDTKEDVKYGPTYTDRYLSIVMEWRRVVMATELGSDNTGVASSISNEIIGNIQHRLWEDTTFGGLAIDAQETSNETYIHDFDQKQLSGALEVMIHYRTQPGDPRVQV